MKNLALLKSPFPGKVALPQSVMGMSDNDPNVARICCYCADKDAGDAWAKARGHGVTHGICDICTPVHFPEMARADEAKREFDAQFDRFMALLNPASCGVGTQVGDRNDPRTKDINPSVNIS